MRKRKWGLWLLLLIFLAGLIFIYAPYFARHRALLTISIYDRYHEQYSVQEDIGLEIDFPLENMNLFPMLVTYNDEGLSREIGKAIRFTVDYTFADFKRGKGFSQIYDRHDPLYNAYVGSYNLVGFGEKLTESDLMLISRYDMLHLALPAVGLTSDQGTFEILEQEEISTEVFISKYPFTVFESTILTNGPEHDIETFVPGDLLFGSSPEWVSNYPLVKMKGKIYLCYFEAMDLNLVFYTLGTSDAVIEEFEEKIIKNIRFTFN